MIPEPIVISELRLGSDIENEHQTWAKFLIVKTVATRREAAAKFKLMALNNEDSQPFGLKLAIHFDSRILGHNHCNCRRDNLFFIQGGLHIISG
jgi:hypothetical protein